MTANEYRKAIASLGWSQSQAGEWLGVSKRTAQTYASEGPSGPAARAIELLLNMPEKSRRAFIEERE